VLDAFLRLLGMPGHGVPRDLTRRIRAYRRLARPRPRVRQCPRRRRGRARRAPCRPDPPVRPLPRRRGFSDGHAGPRRGAPPAADRRPCRSRSAAGGSGRRPGLAGHRTAQPGGRRRVHRRARVAGAHHPPLHDARPLPQRRAPRRRVRDPQSRPRRRPPGGGHGRRGPGADRPRHDRPAPGL
jgi:hypothetical protein